MEEIKYNSEILQKNYNNSDEYKQISNQLSDFTCLNIEDLKSFKIKNIICIGSGYVGTLTMTVLANYYPNIQIKIYDKISCLIDKWNNSGRELKEFYTKTKIDESIPSKKLPIVEKNLEKFFLKTFNENLFFTNNLSEEDILSSDIIFICVNTPSTCYSKIKTNISIEDLEEDIKRGIQLDMNNVYTSVEELCERILNSNNIKCILKERIIIQKSTVPLETLKKINEKITTYFNNNLEKLCKIINNETRIGIANPINFNNIEDVENFVLKYFKLVNIPEFLAEGSAVTNLISPDRVVIGYQINSAESKFASKVMRKLYEKWVDADKIIELDSNSSEMTKLVSNSFLGQRISSINSITELCEITNSDVNKISESVGMDARIGKNYLKASMGFGGSCLKKDILSLIYILSSRNLKVQANYWTQVVLMNEYQRLRVAKLISSCAKETVTIFGLSFKGNTNDARGSNSIFLISYLMNFNITINLYDPLVSQDDVENELKLYNNYLDLDNENSNVKFYSSYKDAHKNSSVLVICNNHDIFKELDLEGLKNEMNESACVFDLYDIYPIEKLKSSGFKIFKLGVYSDLLN